MQRTKKATPAIVAAAHKIDLDSGSDARTTLANRERWQDEVLRIYDALGQWKHAVFLIGDIVSNVRIFTAEKPTDDKEEPTATENAQAKEPLERVNENSDGLGQLIREIIMHGITVGECYLVGLAPRDKAGHVSEEGDERWFIASIKEVKTQGDDLQVKDPDSGKWISTVAPKEGESGGSDYVARMWRRHLAEGNKADSPFRGALSDAEEYLLFGQTLRAIARTRVALAGILKVPSDLSFDHAEEDDPDQDAFEQMLVRAMTAALTDETAGSSAIPLVVRGSLEGLEGLDHLELTREVDRIFVELRDKAMEHVAQDLPLPVEFVFGLGEANHWGGGYIEESAFQQYFRPWVVWAVNSLTKAFLIPSLQDANVEDPKKYLIWYDPSDMTINSQAAKEADTAHDRLTISDETYRSIKGFGKDDAPDDAERARRLEEGRSMRRSESGSPPGATASAEPEDIGTKLADMDRGLLERLTGATEMAMERALHRAGTVLKSRAQRDKSLLASVQNAKPKDVAATMGRTKATALASADKMLEGAWVDLADRFERWVAGAQAEWVSMVPGLQEIEQREIAREQARHRADAWKWLEAELDAKAIDELFSPGKNGHVTQIIREALGRAGGG